MKNILITVIACGTLASCERGVASFNPDQIIAIERHSLDEWGKGNPQAYLDSYAPDITYFDPARAKRANGIQAMKEYLAPFTGKIKVDRFEMTDAKVQRVGDVAVLSYQLACHAVLPDGSPRIVRW